MNHISPAEILLNFEVKNKRDLLALLATEAAGRLGVPGREILDALLAREELGSTALGGGVALPHAQLSSAARPIVLFCRLRQPVDFDARDGEPVDLAVLFLWPKAATKGLLGAMAEVCRVLRDPSLLRKLRASEQPDDAARLLRGGLEAGNLLPGSEADEPF